MSELSTIKPKNILLKVSIFLFSLAIVLSGFVGWIALNPDKQWAPIGELPIQIIHNKSIYPTDIIQVTGIKCFKFLPVNISGESNWASVSQPGIIIGGGFGARIFDPKHPKPTDHWKGNCVTNNFSNPIPAAVAQWVSKGIHIWKITGKMIPTRASGGNGAISSWETQDFNILTAANILGPYPVQKVIKIDHNIVTIEGTLCSKRTVSVITTISWQAFYGPNYFYPKDSIPGSFSTFASGIQQIRKAGCQKFSGKTAFINPINATVRGVDKSIVLDHRWRVVGKEELLSGEFIYFYSTPIKLGP